MDKRCDCILHSLSGLVFGIPVAPDELIAHLDTYSIEKERSTTLHLCQRYGKGDGVYINKLSTELIDVIVDFISHDAREELLSRWSNIYHCYRGGCDFSDHITSEELAEFDTDDDSDVIRMGDREFEVHQHRIWTWISRTRQGKYPPCLKGREDVAKITKLETFDKYDRVRTAQYIAQSLRKR